MPRMPPEPEHVPPVWLGAAVAPWSAPIVLATALALSGDSSGLWAFVEILIYALVLGLPVAAAGTWLLLLPWTLWLRRRGRLLAWRVLAFAAPAGGALLAVALAAANMPDTLAPHAALACVFIGAISGVIVATTFCLVCGIPWRAR
jgi:hypothetical protein